MRLREDDEACREALRSGNFLLYHKLAPLLQKTNSGVYKLACLKTSGLNTTPLELFHNINEKFLDICLYVCMPITLDLEHVLERVGKDKHFVNKSFLLGCTDKSEPQFSLEVGQSIQPLLHNTRKYLKAEHTATENNYHYKISIAFTV